MSNYIKCAGSVCLMAVLMLATVAIAGKGRPSLDTGNEFFEVQKDILSPFLQLLSTADGKVTDAALEKIEKNWEAAHEILLLETSYYVQAPSIANRAIALLERKTGKQFGRDYDLWFQYIWNKGATYPNSYFEFKAKVHEGIDPKFGPYFRGRGQQAGIRLDEVRWGGVKQDGIPPLRNPAMISAKEAGYLNDNDVVFGIEVNGDTRAYPKRILAWHEMFVDTVGEVPVAGVYCTLCGTVILYRTTHEGTDYQLGTSGFLYRSNKLMYDKKTQSLWSTMEGKPVIGPLVEKGIELDYLSTVTTTWGEWKKRHPETTVLSMDTGYRRNYDEGAAYADYFATDELMFTVPKVDTSLKNKDEILAVRLPEETDKTVAIASKFLKKHPIYQGTLDDIAFTVFTDRSGAHRVYRTKGLRFKYYDGQSAAIASDGRKWKLLESELVAGIGGNYENVKNDGDSTNDSDDHGRKLERLPTYNAFWFGFYAAFPDARLVK